MIFARRGAPPREQVVGFGSYFPKSGGHAPTAPKRRALCPSAPGAFAGQQSLHPLCRRSALHPGDFLMRRKSPKTHQEPPGSWTSGEGGLAPFDPLASCPSGIVCDNLNPQTSSEATLPSHGLTAESVPTKEPKEKTRPICPLSLKWQIGLFFWLKVARRDA